jgi:acetyl-CoA carboxylase biotin carboxyl carrier protein
MTIDEIKELIRVVNDTGIAELEVTRGENRVRIRRSNAPAPQDFVLPHAPVMAAHPIAASAAQHMAAIAPVTASPQALAMPAVPAGLVPDEKTVYVKSPIVGTFYDCPSPDAAAFVKVGDRVSAGQVLCIIESMKLMNEIESEVSGTIISKLVENGRPVEYGESLFAIQPA